MSTRSQLTKDLNEQQEIIEKSDLSSIFHGLPVGEFFPIPEIPREYLYNIKPLNTNFRPKIIKDACYKSLKFKLYDYAFVEKHIYEAIKVEIWSGYFAEYKTPEFNDIGIYIPETWGDLRVILMTLYDKQTEKYIEIPFQKKYLGHLISLLAYYPAFGPTYKMYLENKDNKIRIKDKPVLPDTCFRTGNISESDVRLSAHLLLVLMVKTFIIDENIQEQITNFVDNRTKEIRALIKSNDAKLLFSSKGIENAQDIWNTVPKLKETVLYFMFRSRERPEIDAAIYLIADSCMVEVDCVCSFIDFVVHRKDVSELLSKEVHDYLKAVQTLKKELGIIWPLYKVIRPHYSDISIDKFPNLPLISAFVKYHFDKKELSEDQKKELLKMFDLNYFNTATTLKLLYKK